ncbi:hypothetical protein K2173_006471 [Erythroxylum novogranatense]|uniref:PRA1 family protein n=1 Tax=Erythroxylum novogranatense TaxID=1862640 RepID=A0AAV8TEH8_9ROSI|nr:hypothetical protein K2173_006471 [Erythroxylum novogranatense]
MSTPSHFLSSIKQTLTADLRPWSVFLDLASFSLPSSISDATTRITQNLSYFTFNYSIVFLLLLVLGLIYHPLALVAFLFIIVAWVSLYISRDDPLVLFGREVSDLVVLAGLFVATLVVLFWSGVWANFFMAVASCLVLVVIHAALRSTDDLVGDRYDPAPYSNLPDEENPLNSL